MLLIKNGLKQGDSLLPLLFNFVLGYCIMTVQVNQDGLKLNGTHSFLAYTHDANILGGSVHKCTIREKVETLVVANKETGLST
jgi:hypothetical protein